MSCGAVLHIQFILSCGQTINLHVHCCDMLPVLLFAWAILCRVPEASMSDGVLHALILIWDLIGRILSQCEQLRWQTRDQLGFGQPQSLTHA